MRAEATERGSPFCGGVRGDVIWVALADIKEDKLVIELGINVRFKLYHD